MPPSVHERDPKRSMDEASARTRGFLLLGTGPVEVLVWEISPNLPDPTPLDRLASAMSCVKRLVEQRRLQVVAGTAAGLSGPGGDGASASGRSFF